MFACKVFHFVDYVDGKCEKFRLGDFFAGELTGLQLFEYGFTECIG